MSEETPEKEELPQAASGQSPELGSSGEARKPLASSPSLPPSAQAPPSSPPAMNEAIRKLVTDPGELVKIIQDPEAFTRELLGEETARKMAEERQALQEEGKRNLRLLTAMADAIDAKFTTVINLEEQILQEMKFVRRIEKRLEKKR